jgi:hypothetical protein
MLRPSAKSGSDIATDLFCHCPSDLLDALA